MALTPSGAIPGVHPPLSRIAPAIEVTGATRRLVTSGKVGIRPDGSVPADGAEQIAVALESIRAILAHHGYGPADVVKLNVFVTDPALVGPWRQARDAFLGEHRATNTLLVVAGLAGPQYKVEIEAEAVK